MYRLTDNPDKILFFPRGKGKGTTEIMPHYTELWRAYQAWLVSNTPEAADPPPVPENPPLTAEELYDMLETKGVVGGADRPRGRP